jgi:hypothetical protein
MQMPQPVAVYFAADQAKDTRMLDRCFARDAWVRDENQEYHGLDAIKLWQQEAQARYRYVAEPLEASVSGQTVRLRARLTGNFPGSPVELDYTFTLAGDKIIWLEIQ